MGCGTARLRFLIPKPCGGDVSVYRRDHAPERRADGGWSPHRREGVPTNFFVFYEIDEDKSKHSLSLDEYGQEEQLNACTESLSVACVLSRVVRLYRAQAPGSGS